MGRALGLLLGVALFGVCMVWGDPSKTPRPVPVEQCQGQNTENLRELIKVQPSCGKSRCSLIKGSTTTITIRFTPKAKVKNLVTEVNANVNGIDLPFIGVTGTSACNKIKRADTNEDAPCPLEPGVEYIYTNSFPIEEFYPELSLKVHWSLQSEGKDLICFELPAAIKQQKSKKN